MGLMNPQYVNYFGAKAQQLNSNPAALQSANASFNHQGNWTPADLEKEFASIKLTPEQHWLQWGKAEGLPSPTAVAPNTSTQSSFIFPGASSVATPVAAPISQTKAPVVASTNLEIPDVYPYDMQVSRGNKTDVSSSYSGLPTETSGLLQKALTPYVEGISKFETPSGYLNAFNQFRQGLLGSFKPTYEGLISQSLAPLAQKGLLGGQTEDLMLRKITSDLSQSYDATALAETEKYVKNFIASIGGIGELLKYTQANATSIAEEASYRESADPLAPYKLFAQMAAPWLGGGHNMGFLSSIGDIFGGIVGGVGDVLGNLVGGVTKAVSGTPAQSSSTSTSGLMSLPRTTEGQQLMDALMAVLNPSSSMSYYTAKAQQLNSNPAALQSANASFNRQGTWTSKDVEEAFNSIKLTPMSHWEQWGKAEGLPYPSASVSNLGDDYQSNMRGINTQLSNLGQQVAQPSMLLKAGNMQLPIAPLGAIKTQASILGGQSEIEQKLFDTYMNRIVEMAKQMESIRYGQSSQSSESQKGASPGLLTSAADLAGKGLLAYDAYKNI